MGYRPRPLARLSHQVMTAPTTAAASGAPHSVIKRMPATARVGRAILRALGLQFCSRWLLTFTARVLQRRGPP